MEKGLTVFTIGHSTHPLEEFIEILKHYKIKTLVDVRSIPKSRHNPQFNQDVLGESLKHHHIKYLHMKGLGGLRRAKKDSINTAWRSPSFRGFADYMQTEEFTEYLNELIQIAKLKSTVIMCAEAVPWRCHRSLIADALVAHGIKVIEIITIKSHREHSLTPWAKVENGKVTYPERL
jgi:uncharacterized protein (DUF488 family)